jgi:hypothetical protein
MKTVNGARREVSEMIVFWCCTSGFHLKLGLFGSNLRKYAAQNAGNGVSGLQISKILWGVMPPDSPSFASITATVTFQPGSAPGYHNSYFA